MEVINELVPRPLYVKNAFVTPMLMFTGWIKAIPVLEHRQHTSKVKSVFIFHVEQRSGYITLYRISELNDYGIWAVSAHKQRAVVESTLALPLWDLAKRMIAAGTIDVPHRKPEIM